MNQINFQKYIQGDLELSPGKNILLKRTLQKYPGYLLSLSEFANELNAFRKDTFETLASSKKSEIITNLMEAMEKKKFNPAFGEIIEILFGEEGKEGQNPSDFPASFLSLILTKSRLAENSLIRPLFVEFMLTCSNVSFQGSSIIDYTPGLHHDGELTRCKTLNFLYQNFGENVLPKILQEVLKMKPSPSVLFCGTLGHFFCRHPNVRWAKWLKRDDLNFDNWDRKDGRWLFLKELLDTCTRIQYLCLVTGGNTGREVKQKGVALKRPKETSILGLERFRVILHGGIAVREGQK